MKVLLLKEIPKIGHKGEVKDVSDGYAKNALIPKGLVKIATLEIIKQAEEKIRREKELNEIRKNEIVKISNELEKNEFVFKLKAGDKGQVFNSIHQDEIHKKVVEFVREKSGGKLTDEDVHIETKPIKEIGEKVLPIRLGRGEYIKKVNIKIDIK